MDATAWIDAWERARAGPHSFRPVALLAAHMPDETSDFLGRLPLGERDRCLLLMREALFGPTLDAIAHCPACGIAVEFAIDARTLAGEAAERDATTFPLVVEDFALQLRALDSFDLAAAAQAGSVDEARRELMDRAIVSIRSGGQSVAADVLSASALAAVEQALAGFDPAAAIELDLTCPACATRWSPLFDIAAFLWHELESWVERTLADVHTIASAYGWTESTILALSPVRLSRYLAWIRGTECAAF